MATLKDAFEARYSKAYRARISNPDKGSTADSQNDTQVNVAVEDAEADFSTQVETLLDMENRRHVIVAVRLVELHLLEYGGAGGTAIQKYREILDKRLDQLRKTTSRARVVATSTSTVEHSTPDAAHPPFDDTVFDRRIPRPPDESSP